MTRKRKRKGKPAATFIMPYPPDACADHLHDRIEAWQGARADFVLEAINDDTRAFHAVTSGRMRLRGYLQRRDEGQTLVVIEGVQSTRLYTYLAAGWGVFTIALLLFARLSRNPVGLALLLFMLVCGVLLWFVPRLEQRNLLRALSTNWHEPSYP